MRDYNLNGPDWEKPLPNDRCPRCDQLDVLWQEGFSGEIRTWCEGWDCGYDSNWSTNDLYEDWSYDDPDLNNFKNLSEPRNREKWDS